MSDFLFAQPSLVGGAARILDFAGALSQYNTSPSTAEADELAFILDWLALQSDYQAAFHTLMHTHPHLFATEK